MTTASELLTLEMCCTIESDHDQRAALPPGTTHPISDSVENLNLIASHFCFPVTFEMVT